MMKKYLILTALFLTSLVQSQTVTNVSELNTAITNAAAGTTIILANGTWDDVIINVNGKNGTSGNPITITAQSPGFVLMTGNSRGLIFS